MTGRRGLLKLLATLVMMGFGTTAVYGVEIEPMAMARVTRYTLRPPRWPEGMKLRMVLLADFHACDSWMTADRVGANLPHCQ